MILNEDYNYEVVDENSDDYRGAYTKSAIITKDNQKYSVKEELKWEPRWEFTMQISEIHPYDDAEYAWARLYNDSVKFVRGGKVIMLDNIDTDKSLGAAIDKAYKFVEEDYPDIEMDEVLELVMSSDYNEPLEDYIEYVENFVIDRLEMLNEDVEPIMVHN